MARNSRSNSNNSRSSERSTGRRAGATTAEQDRMTDSSWGSGEGQVHAHRTAKIVELVCSSTDSFERAIQNCLEDARETTRGITGASVEGMSVKCRDGEILEYKVNLKVSFGVERTEEP
ncbi:MAG: dodecin [Thermoplasmata archaeon]|nr:dodecin [Thermoplasmata archaeon]